MLFLRRSTGQDFELTLQGLETLRAENVRQGNIILRLEITSGRPPAADTAFERLFEPPHPSAAAHFHDGHAAFASTCIARITRGEATLVTITSSYGADLFAICRSVALRETA